MTHKNDVNVQLLEQGDQRIPAAENVVVHCVAGHRVYGVVEGHNFPANVLLCRSGNGVFHECLMLCSGQIVAVENQEQNSIVDKVTVAAGFGCAQGGFIGRLEMLAVGVG